MRTYPLAKIILLAMLIPTILISGSTAEPGSYQASSKPLVQQSDLFAKDLMFEPDQFTLMTGLEFNRYIPWYIYTESTTELNIQKDSGEFHNFYKFDKLDWHSSDRTEKFSWTTEDTGFVSAKYQVSLIRFDPSPRYWKEPYGLVASGSIPIEITQLNKRVFYIDFANLGPKPPHNVAVINESQPMVQNNLVIRKDESFKKSEKTPIVKSNKSAMKSVKPLVRKDISIDTDANKYRIAHNIQFKPVEITLMRYYVRVVLFNANGKVVNTPSDPVEVLYGEIPPEDSDFYFVNPEDITTPESNLPEMIHPDIKVTRYIPIQNQANDAMYHFVVTRDIPNPWGGNMYSVGDKIDMTPHEDDKSWLEKIGDFFSGIFSFVKDAVNWVSEAYNSIKAFAVNSVVGILGEWSRGPLTMGLEIGLAAMGLPPSIPNFDELTSMGKDYLVKATAEYAGIPPEAAAEAVDIVIEETKKASEGGGNSAVWLKPDPDYYYRPAYLELRVTNPRNVPTNRAYANIHIFVPMDEGEDLFHVPYAFIPSLQPGETITLPVFLEENTDNRMLDTGYYDGMHRFWDHYYNYYATVSVKSWGSSTTYKNPYETTHLFNLDPCYQVHEIAIAAPPIATPAP
jgi:hypothetical protein